MSFMSRGILAWQLRWSQDFLARFRAGAASPLLTGSVLDCFLADLEVGGCNISRCKAIDSRNFAMTEVEAPRFWLRQVRRPA